MLLVQAEAWPVQECPFVRAQELQATPIMPGGSPYMLIANLDESIANCLTWDLFRQGKLTRFLVVGPSAPLKGKGSINWFLFRHSLIHSCRKDKLNSSPPPILFS